jgi:hypothetical protein
VCQISPRVRSGSQGASDGGLDRAGLVLAQDVFVQLLVLLGKDDVVLEKREHPRDGAEALDLGLELANLRVLPVENIAPHGVPANPVGKADGIGGGEKLLRDEELGRLAMITADLIHPEGNGLILVGVFALDHQHRDTVDQKNNILPRTVVAVVKGPLLGDLVNVFLRIVILNQEQVALALLLVVEELTPVTQVLDEVPVAINIAVEMAKSPNQCAPGVTVARVEFSHLGVKQIVKEEGAVLGAVDGLNLMVKAAPLLGFFAGHNRPADSLSVFEDPGLDGIVFSGFHRVKAVSTAQSLSKPSESLHQRREFQKVWRSPPRSIRSVDQRSSNYQHTADTGARNPLF